MGEKKENVVDMKVDERKGEPLSYDELKKVASDLHYNYQKLAEECRRLKEENRQALEALNNQDFNYMSFFLQMLFKVEEHAEMYTDEFVKWATKNIEQILVTFADSMQHRGGDEDKKPEEEKAG